MPRRVRGASSSSSGGIINIPYLARLSPADRILLFVGVGLLGVAVVSYFFLASNILLLFPAASYDSSSSKNDPRLSPELRKIGLSEEALLRRGGGKRISVGPQKVALDPAENALALDIAATLQCDALQEELEREWQTLLDEMKVKKTSSSYWGSGGGAINANRDQGGSGSGSAAGGTGGVGGGAHEDDYFPLIPPDFTNNQQQKRRRRRRRLLDNYNYYGYEQQPDYGLKLTGRHLFCLAAEALTLPRKLSTADTTTTSSYSSNVANPSIHCDINSFEIREELLNLWSSARSQMSEDVIRKTLRVVTEHKETLRGNEVYLWYPEKDEGTKGMLRVLNSGYQGSQTYNFDTEAADSSHDNLYRFHDRESHPTFRIIIIIIIVVVS